MQRSFGAGALALTVAVAAAATMTFAQEKAAKPQPVTVSGTLVDTKCYSMDARNKPVDHKIPGGEMKECARICAKLGIPVAVLTEKGEVWTLVTPTEDLVSHMGETARVTGAVVFGSSQIRPDKIEVKDASGKWTEVKITMPMPM